MAVLQTPEILLILALLAVPAGLVVLLVRKLARDERRRQEQSGPHR